MRKIELVLGFKCNCRCAFCVQDDETLGQVMESGAALRHMARSRKEGAADIDFGGGEPTLRKDLPALARAAASLGFGRIGVKTNGLMLCYPEYVEKLTRSGVNQFCVPVWGSDPAEHDALSQTEGSFEMMEMGVKHVVDLGGDIEVAVLLTTQTVPRLKTLTAHFAELGVRRLRFVLYCLFGSQGARPELLPTLTSSGKAIVETASSLKSRKIALSTTHVPPCFLSPRDDLYLNIADSRLVIITPGGSFPVETSPFESGVKTEKCRGCAAINRCGGVRPEYILRFSDREIVRVEP